MRQLTHMERTLSTAQAAAKAGISRKTLQRWLAEGLLREPKLIDVYRIPMRRWSQQDIDRLRQLKKKLMTSGRPGPRLKGK